MKQFKLLNNIFGWAAFAVAAVTYLLTIEPTASFWDCGEFIVSAYKLDVGHPPGAPFFMLTGRFFSLFASDPSNVAMMVNALSALCSAFTILFLFWTITHLARKVIVGNNEEYTTGNIIAILGAGLVGALAYTFSDTFWFSAVEGEVYAYSSLFTAVVFWLILKWETVANSKGSDRWLILIAYLMGLSIGVHLLNLLAIPAIVLVYYFKKYTPSVKGALLAIGASAVILSFVLYGLIPGFVEVASWFELLFVNTFGLSYNTGFFFYIILAIAALTWAVYETYQQKSYCRTAISFIIAISIIGVPFLRGNVWIGVLVIIAMSLFFYFRRNKLDLHWLNTIIMMAIVMLVGYSSYAVIVVRSAANPPMDQNSPDNVFALKYYLNREQYGDRPLFYGATYNAPIKIVSDGRMYGPVEKYGAPTYAPAIKTSPDEKDEYIITGRKMEYEMNEQFMMFFPRMYDTSKEKIDAYKAWGNVKGKKITFDYAGQQRTEVCPTFGENLRYFFSYQVNFMYFRYLMWNFSGRQNDIQSHGEIDRGNWITGIGFIDKMLVGDQTCYPSELSTENKGHNKYYMLPFLLAILGIFFQLNSGKKGVEGFWITGILFFLTGIAIVMYLNQTPFQPRERDYAYAGSFYAFSIWIGLGVLAIIKALDKFMPRRLSAAIATVACLGVPALMAVENWDDHDRSNRYAARDFGANYLQSCEPNAIIFSNGDNDTFPLWYNQEVEGFRTDIRVCNLSYIQTDWYIDQMKRDAYLSPALPIKWTKKDYISGKNEVLFVEDLIKQPVDIQTIYDFILSDNPKTKHEGSAFIPTKKMYIPVDVEQVIATGTMPEERRSEIASQIDFDLKSRIPKSELIVMEILKENNWERPVYFASTVGTPYYMGLDRKGYFELTGMAYQFLPLNTQRQDGANADKMYDNMMNKFKYGNVNDPNVYLDENVLRMCKTHRVRFGELVEELITIGDTVRAKKAIDYCLEVLPGSTIRFDYSSISLGALYYQLGEPEKAEAILESIANDCINYLNWGFNALDSRRQGSIRNELGRRLDTFILVLRTFDTYERQETLEKYMPYYMKFASKMQ